MRNLLALIGALVIGFLGVGWYMGWYKLSVAKAPDGKLQIKTDIDTDRVADDVSKKLKQLGEATGSQLEKAGQDTQTKQPGAPVNTPGPVTPPHQGSQQPTGRPGWFTPPDLTQPAGTGGR